MTSNQSDSKTVPTYSSSRQVEGGKETIVDDWCGEVAKDEPYQCLTSVTCELDLLWIAPALSSSTSTSSSSSQQIKSSTIHVASVA
jgi:hypothetical protein